MVTKPVLHHLGDLCMNATFGGTIIFLALYWTKCLCPNWHHSTRNKYGSPNQPTTSNCKLLTAYWWIPISGTQLAAW